VIIRRKPSKCFHIISWDTGNDDLVHGSWFRGKIFPEDCDLSWDGRWMVYLAIGANGATWSGICQPPWLRTSADVRNVGPVGGGGVFPDERTLRSNDRLWDRSLREFSNSKDIPFTIEHLESTGETFPVLARRLARDGWKRGGPLRRDRVVFLKDEPHSTLYLEDPGWSWQPSPRHPVLRMFYRGWVHRHIFEFQLEGSDLLDPDVDWATWSSAGDLLVARKGSVLRYSLAGLANGSPDFSCDLEGLTPPTKCTHQP
jgi:hypothetical protein